MNKILKFAATFVFILYLCFSTYFGHKDELALEINYGFIALSSLIVAIGYRLEEIINKK